MSDTTDSLESVTCCGREFRASGDRLTYTPFGDLDFIIVPGSIYSMTTSERDTLVLDTSAGRFRLCNVPLDPVEYWCVCQESQ